MDLNKMIAEMAEEMANKAKNMLEAELKAQMPKRLINKEELAEKLGISPQTIRNEIARHHNFPVVYIGSCVRFDWQEVLAFYKQHSPTRIDSDTIERNQQRKAFRKKALEQ